MRKALIYIVMSFLSVMVSAQGKIVQMGPSFIMPLQERDSVLIADQLFYGFELKGVEEGTQFAFPQVGDTLMTNIRVVKPWQMDTLKASKARKGQPRLLDLRGGLTVTSFDEGIYYLPPVAVQRMSADGVLDTLVFEPQRLEVKTMPVDTATFQPHDIKGVIKYPVTFAEVAPWVAGGLALAGLIALAVWLIVRYRRSRNPEYARKDPAHIVALRKLDKYRGNRMWAPQMQKAFYSGITDTLREYIAARYDIGAMEMTTAEIFKDMKTTDVPADLREELKDLFERADFVKFAKFTASDEDNAKALPLAVRFVTSTYQAEIEDTEISPLPSVGRNDSERVGRNDSEQDGGNDSEQNGGNDNGQAGGKDNEDCHVEPVETSVKEEK